MERDSDVPNAICGFQPSWPCHRPEFVEEKHVPALQRTEKILLASEPDHDATSVSPRTGDVIRLIDLVKSRKE
jgi:hypothetical protein